MSAEVVSSIDVEARLHERMLAGDPLATHDVFDRISPGIMHGLRARYRTTEPEMIEEAVLQALFDYFRHPERFDPSKRSLRGYLNMAAERDLLTLRSRNQRHQRLIRETTEYELATQAHTTWTSGGDIADQIADAEKASLLTEQMMAVAQTDEERVVQELRIAEERSTAVYAQALGWHDLPPSDQQARLYRIKNRLDKRLRRRKASS